MKQTFYQIPIPRKKKPAGKFYKPHDMSVVETFVGEINGLKASDLEERSVRSITKLGGEYEFRVPFVAGRNLPGEAELDFMVDFNGVYQPAQVDGGFAHKAAAQKAEDAVKDAIIDAILGDGYLPVVRIPGDKLQTQDDSDQTWREVLNA